MAAKKRSAGDDVVADAQEMVDELAKAGFVVSDDDAHEARARQSATGIVAMSETPSPLASLLDKIEPVIAGMATEPQPVIRSLQLHRRASITGIRGTADLLTVGEAIESIEPQMLGPVAGFVIIAKKAKPLFLPAASVLAVTVE
jgi:hypothetical protein